MRREEDISFEEAFRQNYDILVKYSARKIGENDAEDIVSEAFLILYLKWNSFESHAPTALTVWLYRTLENKFREHYRRTLNTPLPYDDLLPADDALFIDGEAEQEKYLRYIDEIKKKLSPAELDVFGCIIEHRMSLPETAESLGLSQVAVRVRWMRTRNHIKEFIDSLLF